jgi:hypothetical protein
VKEIGLFVLILCGLAALAVAQALPGLVLVQHGHVVMLAAAAVGIPLQIAYFTSLGTVLSAAGTRPSGWYWRPFAHHHLLPASRRWLVLPFFYAGALAFVVILLAIGVLCLGLADMLLEA